jgi:NADP-dependent 3-hydroxy acid dehydrogenase YdfG
VDDLSGLGVVLTGATGGVGRAVAERLASAGARLALIGRRVADVEKLAGRLAALPLPGDLTDREFVASLQLRVAESWGGAPDVLVNNAGAFELAPLPETTPEKFEELLAVNLRAPFELVRTWVPDMIARGSGHLVSMGSIAGRTGLPGNAAYAASKFGLRGLHGVLVEELRGTGVKASWIEPSAVDTPVWDPIDPDARADLPSRVEMLRPEAIAEAVLFAIAQPSSVSVEEIVIRANPAAPRR